MAIKRSVRLVIASWVAGVSLTTAGCTKTETAAQNPNPPVQETTKGYPPPGGYGEPVK